MDVPQISEWAYRSSGICIVYNWFIAQFPNYNKIPTLKNGKLIYEDKRAKKPEAKIIPLSTDVA